MRCLFVMDDHPITQDAPGGGPVLMYSRLELVAHANIEIHLVLLHDPENSLGFSEYVKKQPETWDRVKSWCASHCVIELCHAPRESALPERLQRILLAVSNPKTYPYQNVNEKTIAAFRNVIAQVKPDLIWAENLTPAVLAWRSTGDIPVIYGHHDWISRILRLHYRYRKNSTWHHEYSFWLLKRIELALVRQVAGCVSASASEAVQLEKINSKHVAYLPTTYEPIDLPKEKTAVTPARIVHLGGMGTVANRIGLQRFLEVAWPQICEGLSTPPELWMVGSMKDAPEPLLAKMKQAAAILPGFAQDLGSVLHPYDIHIIPWEHNTGTRTKIPLILNYAQVVVSTRAAAACLPELKDGENCVLVDDLQQMGRAILALLSDETRRKRIGESGRATFMKQFTREAIQPRFDQFINQLPWASQRLPAAFGQPAQTIFSDKE